MKNILANYHTHTARCGHASGSDREYVEAAVESGFQVLGFSDHSPMIFKSGYKSNFRVPAEKAEEYFNSILSLKEEYKNKIEIHVGVEVEYYPHMFEDYEKYIHSFPCEYLILGQHFVFDEEKTASVFNPNDDVERLKGIYDNLIAAVRTEKFLYVAHPDSIKFTGPSEVFLKEAERFIKVARDYNIPLEINRLGLHDGRNYPRKDFWKLVGEYGNPVIIGADAHNPEALKDYEYLQGCVDLAKECRVNLIKNNLLNL